VKVQPHLCRAPSCGSDDALHPADCAPPSGNCLLRATQSK
jgi:hypothetical protein